MNQKLWEPHLTGNSAIEKLQAEKGFDSYDQLHSWSINNPGQFWSQAWNDLEIVGSKGSNFYAQGSDFISSKFFTDARLNVAENLLAKGKDSDIAVVSILEDGTRSETTWADLRIKVAATAAAMRAEGVVAGDRVVAWVPNITETIIYALGALSVGAVVSTASPDFAPHAVEDRFGQVEPKIFLAADGYQYNGKFFDCSIKSQEIEKLLPTVKKTVLVSEFEAWIKPFIGVEATYEKLPFDHPGFVLFSSGTTGKPKCITHSGAGVMLKAQAEMLYQFNISEGNKVFFFTTCGWMMWNLSLIHI
jgi:acetoacetyl-CoA synthetase